MKDGKKIYKTSALVSLNQPRFYVEQNVAKNKKTSK